MNHMETLKLFLLDQQRSKEERCLLCACDQPLGHSAILIFMAAGTRLLLRNGYFKRIFGCEQGSSASLMLCEPRSSR